MRDNREEGVDRAIASHVINLHMQKIDESTQAEIDIDGLRKYLTYAKMKIFPRLSEEAGHMLQDMYVADRANSKDQ